MSILLPIDHADVNTSFQSADAWQATEWADLDAMHAADQAVDTAGLTEALAWVLCLPAEYQRRLIEICARRLRLDCTDLPDAAVLRKALDRPVMPDLDGLGAWQARMDGLRKGSCLRPGGWKLLSAGMQRWTSQVVDGVAGTANRYLIAAAEWAETYGRWGRLAEEVGRWMREHAPMGRAGEDVSHMSARGRGTYLMAKPEGDLCEMAAGLAHTGQELVRIIREAGGYEGRLTPDELRAADPRHWRRVLRKEAKAARQFWQWALGAASKTGAQYCSDYTLVRWRERQEMGRQWAEATEAVREDGETVSLAAVKLASERAHLARVYVMSKGLEDIGNRLGLTPVFITLTLPPWFHPNPTTCGDDMEERDWEPKYGPRVACITLQDNWALLRAHFHNAGVDTLGLRVVEPHSDGCPHMHAMLWVSAEQVETVRTKLDEVLHWQAELEGRCIVVDRAAYEARQAAEGNKDAKGASPAGYLLKYIVKTMPRVDGVGVAGPEGETAGQRAKRLAEWEKRQDRYDRVRAQMSEMGVRRLAFLGTHGIQRVWQRIYGATQEILETMPARAGGRPAHVGRQVGRRPARPRRRPHLGGRPLEGSV